MARAKAARRVAARKVAASLTQRLSPARAEASRKNGAASQGPSTADGKVRSARNALKHGLCAQKYVVVGDEDPQEFAAFEAALIGELAPDGVMQSLLAGRIARAAWRLERAERIEAELFAHEMNSLLGDGDLGLALIKDGNGARAFDTLLRYRAAAQAELFRALRTLKALQAETQHARPNQPEARAIAGESQRQAAPALAVPDPTPVRQTAGPAALAAGAALGHGAASSALPIEPEGRGNPGETGFRCGCLGLSRAPAGG